MMPISFDSGIALRGLHFIATGTGQLSNMNIKAAAFCPMLDPKINGCRQDVTAPAMHDVFAQVVAGGGKNLYVALRHQFQIRDEALFEEFG